MSKQLIKKALTVFRAECDQKKAKKTENMRKQQILDYEQSERVRVVFRNQFNSEPERVEKSTVFLTDHIHLFYHEQNQKWRIDKICLNSKPDFEHEKISVRWLTVGNEVLEIGEFITVHQEEQLCFNCSIRKCEEDSYSHPAPLTTEQQLVNLLKQLIAENSYQGEI